MTSQTVGCFVSFSQYARTLGICNNPMCRYIPRTCSISLAVVLTDFPSFCTLYKFVCSTISCSISSVTNCLKYMYGVQVHLSSVASSTHPLNSTAGGSNCTFLHLYSFLFTLPLTDSFLLYPVLLGPLPLYSIALHFHLAVLGPLLLR